MKGWRGTEEEEEEEEEEDEGMEGDRSFIYLYTVVVGVVTRSLIILHLNLLYWKCQTDARHVA